MANDLVSDKIWSNSLPMDVAMGVYTSEEICELHGISEGQLTTFLSHPLFQKEVATLRKDMKESGATFKAKARILAEHLIDRMYAIVTDDATPVAIRMKGVENVVRWAGYDRKPVDDTPVESTSSKVPSIEIVLNNHNHSPPERTITVDSVAIRE